MSGGTLADAAALLWPAPTRVHVGRGRELADARREPGSTTYALLPSVDDARLAVPLRPWAAASAVARSQAAAGSTRAAVRNRSMALAFRVGLAGRLLPGRLVVTQAEGARDGLDSALADLLGQDVRLGIRLGPRRANRKPVLQVVSARGRLLAYAKLGTNPLTDRLVRAETAALLQLADDTRLGPVRVPQVLHSGGWQGHPLLVQAPLPVHRAADPGGARLVEAMVAVAGTGTGTPCALVDLPWWGRTAAALEALPPGDVAGRLGAVRDRLAADAAGCALTPSAWHGDWNAGNCSVVPGAVLVWDWERYETGVPAGFDALHLSLQAAISAGVDPGEAACRVLADAARLTAPFGLPAQDAPVVAAAYLWGIGVRYAADDQDGAGAAVGRLGDWLLPVLESVPGAVRGPASAAAETKEHSG
ncbi:MAG: hypothetical protein ACHQE5_01785 [Actinomycetes bacterium]